MRRSLSVFVGLFVFAGGIGASGPFDWKALNEEAEALSVAQAEAQARGPSPSAEALYRLGLVYLDAYKVAEAQEAFEKTLKIDPRNVGGRWGLAEVLRRQHKLKETEEALEALIKEYPDFAPAYISLGYMLYEKQDYGRSVGLGNKVIRMGREKVDTTNYVRALLTVGGAKGMIADRGGPVSKLMNGLQVLPYLKKAEGIQPEKAGVLFGLGSFYLLAPGFAGGDKQKGFEYLNKAAAADPLFPDVFARLAQGYKMQGDLAKAKEYLAKARALDPQNFLVRRVEKMMAEVDEHLNVNQEIRN